ncbi:hypothetical protein [Moorena sp. SIO4A5]|nr:hypothetical protein [Moorena sp. SIO4A5]NEO25059.1 hypothetical protein [Moorena sp. SIO4A5]
MKMLREITEILKLILILMVIADSPVTLVTASIALAVYMIMRLITKE